MIPQRNISLLSNRLAREGGRRIPEAVLERDYCLAWFLVGMSRAPVREHLVFKGGTALKRCYFGGYRFSEDLDFSLDPEQPIDVILQGFEDVFDVVRRDSGVVFRLSPREVHRHLNSFTFFLEYEGPLPARSTKEVKVDITLKERFVCPFQDRPVLRGYTEYIDVPEGNTIRVYSLDEIVVEKVAALTDRARNEPRDLYDVWYLTSEGHVNLADLIPELERKLEFRGRCRAGLGDALARKEKRFRKLWEIRLAAQMADLPRFEEVYRSVRRSLRAAGLSNR